VAAACKVLIEFSLLRLENPDEACAVSQVSTDFCLCGQSWVRKWTLASNSGLFALMLHKTKWLKFLKCLRSSASEETDTCWIFPLLSFLRVSACEHTKINMAWSLLEQISVKSVVVSYNLNLFCVTSWIQTVLLTVCWVFKDGFFPSCILVF